MIVIALSNQSPAIEVFRPDFRTSELVKQLELLNKPPVVYVRVSKQQSAYEFVGCTCIINQDIDTAKL